VILVEVDSSYDVHVKFASTVTSPPLDPLIVAKLVTKMLAISQI